MGNVSQTIFGSMRVYLVLLSSLKAHANGPNIVGQQPPTTPNNVVIYCVRLHGP